MSERRPRLQQLGVPLDFKVTRVEHFKHEMLVTLYRKVTRKNGAVWTFERNIYMEPDADVRMGDILQMTIGKEEGLGMNKTIDKLRAELAKRGYTDIKKELKHTSFTGENVPTVSVWETEISISGEWFGSNEPALELFFEMENALEREEDEQRKQYREELLRKTFGK